MPTTLSVSANEKSTFVVTVSFTDEAGNAVTPNSATWSLYDLRGNVINNREDVSIASLSTTVDIVLSGDDLAITTTPNHRILLIEGDYDGDAGSDLPFKDQVQFPINNLTGVS